MIRALLAAAVLALLAAAPAAAAPPGDWTYLRKDNFRHWACKSPGKGDRFQVRTATSINGHDEAIGYGIGIWAVITRGGNKATVSERQSTAWSGGWIFTKLKGARADDRVWVQGAYYGPTEPWSDGVRVGGSPGATSDDPPPPRHRPARPRGGRAGGGPAARR